MSDETPGSPPDPSEGPAELPVDGVPSPPVRPKHRGHTRRYRLIRTIIASFVILVLLVTGGVAYALHKANGNLTVLQDPPSAEPSTVHRPSASPSATVRNGKPVQHQHLPLNILVLGSDTRQGNNTGIGGIGQGGSDTAIVLHLSGSRKWAVGVSIPRDSIVQLPDCRRPDGSIDPAHQGQFNEAYAIGGPICARDTVEQTTGIRIDHFIVVDFNGFRSMVSAIGGVNVCLPQAIDDNSMHLHLQAGKQRLDGLQALGYVRVRHIGSGSDLDRIKRQQTFISALIQQVTKAGVLFNPFKIIPFISSATKALTVDKGLGSVQKLASLGRQVRGIGLENIDFITVPNEPWPQDPNRVQWTSQAKPLWDDLANDTPLPGTAAAKPKPSSSPTVSPTPTASPLIAAPNTINVRVLNATGVVGSATKAANELRALGYNVVSVADSGKVSTSVVRYSSERNESARTLGAATDTRTKLVTGLGQVIELVVGTDYVSAHSVTISSPTSSPTPSPSFSGRNAAQDICS